MRKQKTIVLLTILILAISITAPMALAKKENNPGKHLAKGKDKVKPEQNRERERIAETEGFGKCETPAASNGLNKGNSPVEHLYLFEKDPETWEIVEDGAWAKITILTHKDKFIFNGHGLDEFVDYSLINYAQDQDWDLYDPDVVPDQAWPLNDILIGDGTVKEEGNIHIKGTWSSDIEGKIWLVLSEDYNDIEENLEGWNPEQYLFEYDLLRNIPH